MKVKWILLMAVALALGIVVGLAIRTASITNPERWTGTSNKMAWLEPARREYERCGGQDETGYRFTEGELKFLKKMPLEYLK